MSTTKVAFRLNKFQAMSEHTKEFNELLTEIPDHATGEFAVRYQKLLLKFHSTLNN